MSQTHLEQEFQKCNKSDEEIIKTVSVICDASNTKEDILNLYDLWASTYEEDMDSIDRKSHIVGAKSLMAALGDKKDAPILDLACGTGLVGEILQKEGFHNIDGLDASSKMLDIAREKNVYNKLICSLVSKEPLSISQDCYAAIVCVGGFYNNGHLQGDCFPELIRITKPGGVIVLTINFNDPATEAEIEKYVNNGTWHWEKTVVKDYTKFYPGAVHKMTLVE